MTPPPPNSDAAGLLAALADALEILLRTSDLDSNVRQALCLLREQAQADRSYLFDGIGPNGDLTRICQRIECVRPGISAQIDNPVLADFPFADEMPRWFEELSRGNPVFGSIKDFPAMERPSLEMQEILSLAVVPIMQRGRARGFIGFDACTFDRTWSAADIQVLRALAAAIGGAMERSEVEGSLSDYANDLLRSRRVALSLMEDAQIAQKRADAANQEKSRFLAVMSHEMRTPLNGILGFAELIASESTGDTREHAETIQASGRLLLTLISDLLDFSKIEAGRLEILPTDGVLRDHVARVLAIFTPTCTQRGIKLKLEYDEQLPAAVHLDFIRLEQVLLNLVGNAVKFTPSGTICIRLSLDGSSLSPPQARFEVIDSGIGIDSESFTRIFEPFSQAHSGVHRQFGGTGLGLAICKRLVALLGGELSVDSAPGRGSTFHFTIPLHPASAPISRTGATAVPIAPDAKNLRVLVVDDVAANRDLAAALLRRMGAAVTVAEDGPTALRAVAEAPPHLILMDILMPGMEGTEVARILRTDHASPIPIAALSADATSENEARCLAAGMNFFLTKPINRRALEDVVRRVLAAVPESGMPG